MKKKPVVTMREWALRKTSAYEAPEIPPRLSGAVYGHPSRPDGEVILTSRIVAAEGRRIETANTVYLLDGPPEAAYVAWCKEHDIQPPDPENPIRVLRITGSERLEA